MTARKALLKCTGAGVMPGWGGSVLRAGKARREKSWSPENASAKTASN